MSTVLDASVLVAAAVDSGPVGTWAESLFEDGFLAAPHLVLAEATNILRRLELKGRLTSLEAISAQREILQLDLSLFPFEPFAERIWQLRNNVTSYDAWYVAIAEACSMPLATLDKKLARANGPECSFLLSPAPTPG